MRGFNHKIVGDKNQLEDYVQTQHILCQTLKGKQQTFKAFGHFVTGMGNPHPVENGFAWHPTLGVPYLTGAAVKGLVRSYFENNYLDNDKEKLLWQWFGSNNKDPKEHTEEYPAKGGALIFFDAIPVQPVTLGVDIMTPHMGDWYAKGATEPNQANTLPADWHDPVPVSFLVAKDITLLFSFALRSNAPDKDKIKLKDVAYVLEQALQYAGAGAKTATGYGAFEVDSEALKCLQQALERKQKDQKEVSRKAAEEAQKAARLAALSPLEKELEQLGQVSEWVKALESKRWQDEILKEAAHAIKQRMQKMGKWLEQSKAKKPEKDKDYQATLKVKNFL